MKTLRFIFHAPRALAWACGLWLGCCATAIGDDLNPVLKGSWPGFKRGPATAVALSGNYAYVTTSGGVDLEVIDISDPSSPHRVGGCNVSGCFNCVASVAVLGNFAYVANYSSLHVIDISDPVDPHEVGSYGAYEWYANSVAVSGDFAYVTARRFEGSNWIVGLQVFDVSTPADPQGMGWCASSGEGRDLVVSGNYAYVAEADAGIGQHGCIEVIDISNPAAPKRAGRCDIGNSWKVAVSGHYAYLGGSGGLKVIDISDPANPKQVGEDHSSGNVFGLAVSGHYACAGTWGSLEVIDVSNPARPQRVGGSNTGGLPASIVAVSGNYAYVAFGDGGLQVIEISNPVSPQPLGVNETNGRTVDVAVSRDHAYLAEGHAGLKVIDVSNAACPRKVGAYYTFASAAAVAVSDKYAYLTESDDNLGVYGLEMVDISNPADPKHVGWYETGTGGGKAVLSGNYAYLAGPDGLQVIDVSHPADPRWVGGYAGYTGYSGAQSVAVVGDHAYVANGGDGLLVLNVSNPANLIKVGGYKTGTSAGRIAVSGHFAYLADADGFHVIDISNPANPPLVGRYEVPGGWWIDGGMAADGNYVYVVLEVRGLGDDGRLEVIDVSNPASPQRVGGYNFEHASELAVSGNQVHLANGGEGLLILEMQPFVKSIAKEGQDLKLSWEGFGPARLQRATRLPNPDWHELPGYEATNSATLPITDANAFFRLVKP